MASQVVRKVIRLTILWGPCRLMRRSTAKYLVIVLLRPEDYPSDASNEGICEKNLAFDMRQILTIWM